EETRDAALLLHVVEAGASDRDDLMHHVDDVLQQIGADEVPQLVVCNKIDQLDDHSARLDRDENGRITRVWLSAKTGEGLDLLRQALQEYFPEHHEQLDYIE
ncbi:MAG: GTPase HflX, partial [Gammaproteobacteria bacterium]